MGLDVDVVVVGAGSAGAVMAARLSEDAGCRVVLLEAGPDHRSADTPASVSGMHYPSAYEEPGRFWPDLLAVRAPGQAPGLYVRGRGVGGSSAVNAMVGLRGTPQDYDRWERELGCAGWGWAAMEQAFLRVEDDADFADARHGRGGPIPLTRVPRALLGVLGDGVEQAVRDLGYASGEDHQAPGATGWAPPALTARPWRRVSTNDAYLEAARDRPNLVVRGDTLVDRVALDGARAIGVVLASGEEISAETVVVSAGAIHSPAILLRSGIGPEIGRPVGRNLMEHARAAIVLSLTDDARMHDRSLPVPVGLVRYSSGLAGAGDNDMQLLLLGSIGGTAPLCDMAVTMAACMRVYSRGEVRLASTDPNVDPIVEFNLLSDERDLVRLRDGTRRLRDVVLHPRLRSLWTEAVAGDRPLDELPEDDTALDAWLRATVGDYVHAAGTCRLGRPDDPDAVVDPSCRVIGFDGVYVVDASVMPDLPRANTHLTTVAVAERAAAAIRTALLDDRRARSTPS